MKNRLTDPSGYNRSELGYQHSQIYPFLFKRKYYTDFSRGVSTNAQRFAIEFSIDTQGSLDIHTFSL